MGALLYNNVKGYACKLNHNDFYAFKKDAQIEDDSFDPSYPFYALDGDDLNAYSGIDGEFTLISIAEFVSKLKGIPYPMTRAEILARFNITVTD